MKQCKYCLVWKPLSEFSKAPANRGGLQHKCKACKVIEDQRPDRRLTCAKGNAKRRKIAWNLTLEEYSPLVAPGTRCDYCHRILPPSRGVGLDRIDNSRGYEIENVVPCCGRCNMARGHLFSRYEMKVLSRCLEYVGQLGESN